MTAARRTGRWLAAAAAVAGSAVAAAIALRGSAPETPASAGLEAGAPGAVDAGIVALAIPPETAEAMRLVASAKAEAASGNLAQARVLLTRAYAVEPRPSTLLELAAIQFQTGDCRAARRAAQGVVAAAPGELARQARDLLGKIGRCD